MAQLEPLNENDTGSFKEPAKPRKRRPEGPSLGGLKAKRFFWIGCRLVCDLSYAIFGFLSLCGGYLFLRQLYDYFQDGTWASGSLHAILKHWVPESYLKGWFPYQPGGSTDTLYWFMDNVPAAVFLVVIGLGVLLLLTSIRWNFVIWEQQAMVKITTLRRAK